MFYHNIFSQIPCLPNKPRLYALECSFRSFSVFPTMFSTSSFPIVSATVNMPSAYTFNINEEEEEEDNYSNNKCI